MNFREATIVDIPQLQFVRNAVRENALSNPAIVPDKDVEDYIIHRGKGWVCEIDNKVVGFAIVSVDDNNVWALFVQPGYDKQGIGKRLHDDMMHWYFSQTDKDIWLSTAPDTRAEEFYRTAGWRQTGVTKKSEIKFEMTAEEWKSNQLIE